MTSTRRMLSRLQKLRSNVNNTTLPPIFVNSTNSEVHYNFSLPAINENDILLSPPQPQEPATSLSPHLFLLFAIFIGVLCKCIMNRSAWYERGQSEEYSERRRLLP